MRCLVTGVAGFVGSSLSEQLLQEGHEVVGIDCFIDYYPKSLKLKNLESLKSYDKFTFVEQNLLSCEIEKLMEGVNWVFHQAAQAGVRASWGKLFSTYTDNNILATQRILEAAKVASIKANLKKIVFASSSSVYGTAETLPTLEDTLPKPISPYGVTKLAAEHLMVLYAKEFAVPTASLRYFTVYGPRQRPDMAFHRFARAALEGSKISIYGDGEQSRDFTFIADIVRANILAAEKQTESLVFNIGGGSRVTVNQVLDTIREITGKKINVDYLDRQAGDARHTGADTSLANRELGYSPTVKLVDGLKREVSWMEELLASGGY